MGIGDYTRANEFDRVVGRLQTENVILHSEGNSLLDVGCGIGEYTPMYLKRFKRVVGIDPMDECLVEARKVKNKVEYIKGFGETFETNEKFDVICMNALLEHVDDPVELLRHCRKFLNKRGRIIIHVPNSGSIARRLGVLMGVIPSLNDINEKEAMYYGHQRVYTQDTLKYDCEGAGLIVLKLAGLMYKPLPNMDLLNLYKEKGEMFLKALVEFGKDRPDECACLYAVCV